MEGVVPDYLNNDKIVIEVNTTSEFYSYPSKDNNQDAPETQSNMMNIYQQRMDEYIMK